jgi:uncharacterized protein (DUF1800 family)
MAGAGMNWLESRFHIQNALPAKPKSDVAMTSTLSRRSFFTSLIPSSTGQSGSGNGKRQFNTLSDPLAPFVPDASNPWNEYLAGHLLRRTMMAPTWADIEALVALGDPGDAVDLLLNATSTPGAPSIAGQARQDPNSTTNVTLQGQYLGQLASDTAALRSWWENLHLTATNSIQEKMVAFWSGHFTTEFDLGNNSYVVAQLLYIQNQLFRSNALGNFQDLVKAVTLDGGMLVFLGGNLNVASAPNENYARELMELFTCGISGGYTEADVQAAARILTGWQASIYAQEPDPNGMFQTFFVPGLHDTSDKTYFETDFPAIDTASNTQDLVQTNEIDKLIDVLFTKTAQSIATFICTKIYQFFVYSDTDTSDLTEQTVISELAALFMQNNWEIKPVISTLLKSAHFFDNVNIGCQNKTPAEYVIGLARQLNTSYSIDGNMTNDQQQFFQPPNVSGWPGYQNWLTTTTYPIRTTGQAQPIVQSLSDSAAIAFITQFPLATYSDVDSLAKAIGQLLLPRPLSTQRETNFTYQLLGTNTNDGQWPTVLKGPSATLAANIRSLLNYIIALPDFQLC